MELKPWLSAFRLRTLPLALSCIGMGGFLAATAGKFNTIIFLLCCLTTVFLQVLSNLANDYGDSVNGADHAERSGPKRSVQSGVISLQQMKRAVAFFVVLCLASGISLLWGSFGWDAKAFLFLLAAPLFVSNGLAVSRKPSVELDPYLKKMALSTMLFVILFGTGFLLA